MADENDTFDVQLYMLQLFLVPLLSVILGFFVALPVTALAWNGASGDIATHISFALAGFFARYILQRKHPAFYSSGGRWGTVYTSGFMGTVSTDPKCDGDAIAILPVTAPTIGVCFYSIGMVVSRRISSNNDAV